MALLEENTDILLRLFLLFLLSHICLYLFNEKHFIRLLSLINKMPTQVLGNISHFKKLHNQLRDHTFLRVFGCSYFLLLRPYNQHKLDFHTKKCVFISYSPLHKGYKCLDRYGRVFIARHVTFNETKISIY